jgi:hypothetical protein
MPALQNITSVSLLFFCVQGFAKDNLINSGVKFTENKGQVIDQNYQPRSDIKYYGQINGLSFFLKESGISYQLYKKGKNNNSSIIQRLDVSFLGLNNSPGIIEGKGTEGYDNFYNSAIPVLEVRSFADITYKEIYPSIDLIYYSKEGNLKYDFKIMPGGDYKKIKLQIEGATSIKKREDGSIIIATPIGDIREEKPLVYQDGNSVESEWIVEGNALSFKIGKHEKSRPLIIDPMVSQWTGNSSPGFTSTTHGSDCLVDDNGNIYWCGQDQGAAYLRKFNSGGTQLFSTYYPAMPVYATDPVSCSRDANNNIFLAGYTQTTSGIATSGSFQVTFGGGVDGVLIKTNSNGVKQWATYYGGTGNEYFNKCVTDQNNNVYAAGSTNAITGMATGGSHQSTYGGGGSDGLFVKFNSAGVRVWATYYGGAGSDDAYGCTMDKNCNLFICGSSSSNSGIATPGSYQNSFSGNTRAGYIAKFDTSGVRQWSSYFGTDSTSISKIEADTSGNLYFLGTTSNSVAIGTPGTYLPAYTGSQDIYLAKFSNSGSRIWGTYTGTNLQGAVGIAVNTFGKIFMASNYYLKEFDTAGQFSWSYYAGVNTVGTTNPITVPINISNCYADASGNAFITGGYQTSSLGSGIGYIKEFVPYNIPTPVISVVPGTSFCQGDTVTLNTALVTGATYTWYRNGISIPSSNSPVYKTVLDGTYKVKILNNFSTDSSQLVILTQLPKPNTIITKSNVSCFGGVNGTISILSSNAPSPFTYTWNNLSNTSPSITGLSAGTYISMTTSSNGCFKKDTTIITQPGNIIVSHSTSTVPCSGALIGSVSLSVSGGIVPYHYTWNSLPDTTSIIVNLPTGTYVATITDDNGCIKYDTSIVIQDNLPMPSTPLVSICAVTVDSATGKNKIIYEKNGIRHSSLYKIYRETSVANQYTVTGSQPSNAYSTYIDTSSVPAQQPYRYKITEMDSCGNEFSLSPYHKTIHLTSNVGVNNEINLLWNQYEGVIYSTHFIYRSVNGGLANNLAQVSSSTTSFTDLTPPAGQKTYWVSIDNAINCNPSFKTTLIDKISSNSVIEGVNTVDGINNYGIRVIPNPTSGVVTIIGAIPHEIKVIDALGKLVATEKNKNEISLSALAEGIYLVRLFDLNGKCYFYQQVIKE